MATKLPPLSVSFDDGATIEVQPKTRDAVRAEALGVDLAEGKNALAMWAMAYTAMKRLERAGTLPEGATVPESLDEFIDSADVEPVEQDDAEDEGKGSGQEAATG